MKRRLISALCLLAILASALCAPAFAEAGAPEALLSAMSFRQMIMQKIMVSFTAWSDADPVEDKVSQYAPVTQLSDALKDFYARYQPGGTILFKGNVPATGDTVRLISDMQAAVASSGAPAMLIAIDQEGGRITRLIQGTSLPGNMALGAAGRPEMAKAAGEIIGSELSALGVNMNCAPSLDVNCNPLNPIINVRSFGEDPGLVAEMGVQMIDGLRSQGVISAVKHFPGHGDTSTDSHTDLPLVDKSREEIFAVELKPFQAAIDAGVDVIMSAHIQYPALDDTKAVSASTGEEIGLPATLSRKILTDVLRGEMGFQGVVITDAMDMDAIATHFGQADAVVRAFAAGVDIALMPVTLKQPRDFAQLDGVLDAVEAAVADGRIDRAELEASVLRVLRLKEKYGILSAGAEDVEGKLDRAEAVIASAEHRAQEREIARAAVTAVANDGTLPIRMEKGQNLLLIGAYENELTAMAWEARRLMAEGALPEVRVETYCYKEKSGMDEALEKLLNRADAVLAVSEIGGCERLMAGQWQSDFPLALVSALNRAGTPYCILSVYLPQDAALLTDAKALLCCYCAAGMSDEAVSDPSYAYGPAIPAAVDAALGACPANGKLPVTVYALDGNRQIDMSRVLYPAGYSASAT